MIRLNEQIALAVTQNGLDDAYGKVIIGFSGGADSSALLHYFKDKAKEVVCVHVNHMIRGDEAKRDEIFCTRICEEYGVEIAVYTVDVPKLAKEKNIGLEQMAREVRYEIFECEYVVELLGYLDGYKMLEQDSIVLV